MTDKETMKLALDALETECDIYREHDEDGAPEYILEAITALKERLAQPEQEPAAVWELFEDGWDSIADPEWMESLPIGTKLYTHPPQRTEQEPVAFKIYKPTPPRGAIPNVRDAELPWVYDQDPSSGNVASMWVTPVKATPPQRTWVGLTEQEHTDIAVECGCMSADWVFYGAAVERKIKEKNTI